MQKVRALVGSSSGPLTPDAGRMRPSTSSSRLPVTFVVAPAPAAPSTSGRNPTRLYVHSALESPPSSSPLSPKRPSAGQPQPRVSLVVTAASAPVLVVEDEFMDESSDEAHDAPRFSFRGAASNGNGNGVVPKASPSTSSSSAASSSASSSGARLPEEDAAVKVKFCLQHRTSFGQSVKLIGSHPAMGAWDLSKAPALQWGEGDRWATTLELPACEAYEYKYVLVGQDGHSAIAWQQGNNAVLAVADSDAETGIEVVDNWSNDPASSSVKSRGQVMKREDKLRAFTAEIRAMRTTNLSAVRRAEVAEQSLARKVDEVRAARERVGSLHQQLGRASQHVTSVSERAQLLRRRVDELTSMHADGDRPDA